MGRMIRRPDKSRFLLLFLLFFINGGFLLAQSDLEALISEAQEAEKKANTTAAIDIYRKAIELCEQEANQEQLPLLLFKQAQVYCYTADYDAAIKNLTLSYELIKMSEEPNLELEARIFVQYGIIFFFMQRWDDALSYYEKAWVIALKLESKDGLSIINNNIGNIYQKKKDYLKAIESYKMTLAIQQELKDSATICNATYNIGSCFFEENKMDKAYEYFIKAYEIATSISDVEISVLSQIYLGEYYLKNQLLSEAYKQLDLAEKTAIESGYSQLLFEVYKKRVSFQTANGNYKEALATQKKLHLLSDSIFTEKSLNKLRDFQVKYETLEKEKTIQLQEASIKKKNIQFIAVLVGFVLTLIIVFLLILFYRLQKKHNRELVELNETRDKFYAILSHDLKNPAIVQRNTLQTLVDHFEQLDKEVLLQNCTELLRVSNQQIELLYNLLNWGQLKTNLISSPPIFFDLNSAIEEATEFTELQIKEKELSLHYEKPEQAIAFGHKRLCVIALQNLLANAIKFSYSGNEIGISVALNENNMWEISVIDHGMGITADRLPDLFTHGKSSKGTAGEAGSGLGLLIVKEAVEKNSGEISVKSEHGKGSIFTFTIQQGEE